MSPEMRRAKPYMSSSHNGGCATGLKPLELDHDHVAVEALGFSAEDAAALGIGYANRGIMRGFVAGQAAAEVAWYPQQRGSAAAQTGIEYKSREPVCSKYSRPSRTAFLLIGIAIIS